ncbi:hypothetical protein WR25_11531 [Diploscapter pachys]|uniref:Uncharacterized protein n=1 Tax=Diploscapter pachys TaxID=2018661 RepID=A0A2A2KAD6_9BILA|nr:hypothetical protein WR25_11531 [Diploscapter pachys]
MVTTAGLSGWRSWLTLKHSQLDAQADALPPVHSAGSRIEIADLKERIRKLEAIAAGVDLGHRDERPPAVRYRAGGMIDPMR